VLKFVVHKHPRFRKSGDDILSTEWITISQAALGTVRSVDTAWGKRDVRVPEGSQDGSTLFIKGDV
jgi:DnaJ-class molecular chaperone